MLSESMARSRLEAAGRTGLTPLVGREPEVALLRERWAQVKEGLGQVVLLSGEAGIGKSRLVQVLTEQVATEPQAWLTPCQCSPYYQNTALYPLIDLLERVALRFEREESPDQKHRKLEGFLVQYGLPLAEAVPLFAALLSLPLGADYAPLTVSPEQQKQKTLHALLTILLRIAAQQPVLFVMEDLHWVDPTTLEFLSLLVDQGPTARILALFTFRPDFSPPWTGRSHVTQVTLNRLPHRQAAEMTDRVARGKALPSEVVEQIVAKTDGVPLFVEELTKMVLESELLQERDDHYALTGPLPPLAIPTTLHDSLMARLDRLATVKALAQLGAVLGREFAYDLLQAVSLWDEDTLQRGLHQLVEAEFLYQRGLPPQATYAFKHALIQEAAYQSLLRSTRQQYHQRIAEVLSTQFPDTGETQPELLAHHYTAAALNQPAMEYWQKAGQKAFERSAHVEAIAHLTKALTLLQGLPATSDHARQELTLQRMLGVSLLATKGFAAPEVKSAYVRARELCQQVGDISHIFPVLFGLWGYYHLRMEWQTTRELAEELLALAQRHQDPGYLLMGHRALGDTLSWLGEFVAARTHLEAGIALYDFDQHHTYAFLYGQDPLMGCRAYAARVLWILGYPDQALQQSEAAVTVAQQLAHPFSLGFALNYAADQHGLRREWQAVLDRADMLLALCAVQEFAQWAAQARIHQSRALVMQGNQEAMARVRQGIIERQNTGARTRTVTLVQLAELHLVLRQAEEALHVVVEGLAVSDETGERWMDAELYRLKGESWLALSGEHHPEAESCFHQALDLSRVQQAKSWELRAATSLARLWQQQGKRIEAYELLAPVYNWFSEGFDTADMQEAKAFLERLS